MKYGAVNVASQALRKPIVEARPNVYERRRWEGNSPPHSQAYVATIPLYATIYKTERPTITYFKLGREV
jgi:hypothetical protein